MIAWLIAAALAAPPEGIMSEEVGQWAPYWSAIQDGPLGCWEVTGTAAWDWDLGRYGITKGSASFAARFEDGVWKDFLVRSLGESHAEHGSPTIRTYPHDAMHFAPLIGTIDPSVFAQPSPANAEEEEQRDNILEALLAEIGDDVTTSWSEWSDKRRGIVVHRTMPVGAGGRAEGMVSVLFPDGGLAPSELDITFDEPFSMPKARAVRMRYGDVHLRGRVIDGETWPESEAFSFEASILGYRVWASQTIQYHAFRTCGGAVEFESAPLSQ